MWLSLRSFSLAAEFGQWRAFLVGTALLEDATGVYQFFYDLETAGLVVFTGYGKGGFVVALTADDRQLVGLQVATQLRRFGRVVGTGSAHQLAHEAEIAAGVADSRFGHVRRAGADRIRHSVATSANASPHRYQIG